MIEKYLDIETWNRKDHYLLYSKCNQPFFGFTAHVECTHAYRYCKKNQCSFYLYYIHKILLSINAIENCRLRIVDGQVALYDVIHASPTVGRDDTTFGFSFLPFDNDYDQFAAQSQIEIDRIKRATGLCMSDNTWRKDTIHLSAVPWIDFTMVQHAGHIGGDDSCPKISIGKLTNNEGKYYLAISFHAHHALVDGYHAGLFYDRLSQLLNSEQSSIATLV